MTYTVLYSVPYRSHTFPVVKYFDSSEMTMAMTDYLNARWKKYYDPILIARIGATEIWRWNTPTQQITDMPF